MRSAAIKYCAVSNDVNQFGLFDCLKIEWYWDYEISYVKGFASSLAFKFRIKDLFEPRFILFRILGVQNAIVVIGLCMRWFRIIGALRLHFNKGCSLC